MIKVVKNVLDVAYATELYKKCVDLPYQQSSTELWSNLLTANKNAPEILLNKLDTIDHDRITGIMEQYFGKFNTAYLTVQRWEKGCYIPWHNDKKYDFSATIYLNPEWDESDGGQFVYAKGDDLFGLNHSYTPQFNTAVMLKQGHFHCVSPISTSEKIRVTIQFFAHKG